jgi:transcriptional regulator with XRE-family HTH domain
VREGVNWVEGKGDAYVLERLGKAIRTMRKCMGLTQIQLAERMGTSQGMVSYWENGLCDLTVTTLYAIANALETDVRNLV